MKRYVLSNGLKVLVDKRPSSTVAIEICVMAGSNNEDAGQKGISHFLEHLLFEGSTKRPDSMAISNEIEKIGGELNAATATERTIYYAKVQKKHFSIALDVLSDIIQNPTISQGSIDKERKIIIDEINMVIDDPRFYQWVIFHHALFQKHPAKHPVYGSKETVNSMSRDQILEYYQRFYVPNNIIVTVVGGVNGIVSEIRQSFRNFQRKPIGLTSRVTEPAATKPRIVGKNRQILQSYMVLGYKALPRAHADSYALDVIRAHLGRGQSGKLFQTLRSRHSLCYDVGVVNESNIGYGIFAVYVGTNKKNISRCRNLILEEFKTLDRMSEIELSDAKNHTEGEYLLSHEDNFRMADTFTLFELSGIAKDAYSYIKNIKKVTLDDVRRVAGRYLTKNYTMAVIRQD